MEIWKDIPEWEWYYQASTRWRIRSLDRIVNNAWKEVKRKWKILAPWDNKKKYLIVILCRDWENHTKKVHRLALITFKGLHKTLDQCNHIDWNKQNNNIWNLEWTNNSWNQKHSYEVLWRKSRDMNWWKNPNAKQVWQYDIDWKLISKYDTQTQAMKKTWIKQALISHCCIWRNKTAWWYIWKFIK